eukprot:scaffold14368_cov214-Skeletonema_dohrnii-CCMP3373.AAC.6
MAVLDDEVGMRWSGRRSAVYENGIVTWFGMMGAQRYRKSDTRKAQNKFRPCPFLQIPDDSASSADIDMLQLNQLHISMES